MYVCIQNLCTPPQPRYTFLEASPRRCGFGTFSILLRSGPTPTCSVQQACFFFKKSVSQRLATWNKLEGDLIAN